MFPKNVLVAKCTENCDCMAECALLLKFGHFGIQFKALPIGYGGIEAAPETLQITQLRTIIERHKINTKVLKI